MPPAPTLARRYISARLFSTTMPALVVNSDRLVPFAARQLSPLRPVAKSGFYEPRFYGATFGVLRCRPVAAIQRSRERPSDNSIYRREAARQEDVSKAVVGINFDSER